MKRFIMVLGVMAIMAAMVAASAMPAFARINCNTDPNNGLLTCSGGGRFSGGAISGGSGRHLVYNLATEEQVSLSGGGGGGGSSGTGSGKHCDSSDCQGRYFSGHKSGAS